MVYTYECDCGHKFDEINTVENRHNAECPKCLSLKVIKLMSNVGDVSTLCYERDLNGEPIWFPKDGKPYFDRALRRVFKNAKEKQAWMREKKIVMRGDTGPSVWKDGSGDMKNRSYRKENRWDD